MCFSTVYFFPRQETIYQHLFRFFDLKYRSRPDVYERVISAAARHFSNTTVDTIGFQSKIEDVRRSCEGVISPDDLHNDLLWKELQNQLEMCSRIYKKKYSKKREDSISAKLIAMALIFPSAKL